MPNECNKKKKLKKLQLQMTKTYKNHPDLEKNKNKLS